MLFILIVDDEPINLMLLSLMIEEKKSNKIFEANNGKEAIDIILSNSIDIVLMDVNMPIMDGITATQYIREHISKEIPVIAVTACDKTFFMEKFHTSGFTSYVPKPVNKKELLDIIELYRDKKDIK